MARPALRAQTSGTPHPERLLLPYAESGENLPEDIFRGDFPGDGSEFIERVAQIDRKHVS